jgi:hypothetical protein
MWRLVMNYRYKIINGTLCIFGQYRTDSAPFALFPFGVRDAKSYTSVLSEISEIVGFPLRLYPLDEKMCETLKPFYPNAKSEFQRDFSDYVYNTADLAELAGNKFHKKRNHVNKFISMYGYDYIPITEANLELLDDAINHMFYNCDDNTSQELVDEYNAIHECLYNFSALNLKAAVIKVADNIVAYSIGEKYNADTAVIHTEKADKLYSGSYAFINYEFVRREFSDTLYVNREEDLGIDGLRQAKSSYNPIKLNNVYQMFFKNKEDFYHVKSCNVKQMACSRGWVCK